MEKKNNLRKRVLTVSLYVCAHAPVIVRIAYPVLSNYNL